MSLPVRISSTNRAPFLLALAFLLLLTIAQRPSALITFAFIALAGSLTPPGSSSAK